jgi:lysophospholipid acyltransferase (LPLAT)-like uncharacterized protein
MVLSMIKRLSQMAVQYGLITALSSLTQWYVSLFRLQAINAETLDNRLKNGKKAIVAMWHQRILAGMPHAIRYGSFSPAVMISQSRDGDMIAEVYQRLKFHPVRGSSSRGGKKGLLAMVHYLKSHLVAVHVIDGPQGPRGVIKEGLISLAQHAQAPIIPAYVSASRTWVLNSWDRCLIPKPFSKVVLRFDDPIMVPEDLSPEAYEKLRQGIEERMLYHQRLDDKKFGHENLI